MPTEEGQKLRHACSTCCRSFSNKRDLVKHQYMHREKPNLVCLHCNKNFTTESNYRRHINALQNVEKKGYNCGNCGSLFRRLRDLEQHHELKHRDDKVFRCKVCQAEFSWHENLLKHQQVHEVNPHVCTVCNHEFIDMTSLLVHRRTHHLSLSAAELPHKTARMVISQQPEASTDKPFTCHICGRRFKFDFSYQTHLDAHVIPASSEKSVHVGQGSKTTSQLSKPVYVQMDSEGIIDLPAFSSSTNEDVEIIVEVGNVTTPVAAAAGTPVSVHIPMICDDEDEKDITTCMKSEMDKRTIAADGELLKTSEGFKIEHGRDDSSVTGINDNHEDKNTSGSIDRNDRDSELMRQAEQSEGPPEIDRMDVADAGKPWATTVTSLNLYSTRPKKPIKRKRERVPFQFNCVMTDDKPFVCSTCGEAFRWEISLQVHIKVHTEGKVPGMRKIYNLVSAADKKMAMKSKGKVKNSENVTGKPGIKKSRIVYRRDSSDEEEDVEEDRFAFGNEPEEEESSQVVLCHGKKSGQRMLRPDNADDMLLEYLIGDESFTSLKESNATNENEVEEYRLSPEEGVLQNKLREKHKTPKKHLPDDSWRKGKAILRKKRTWKPSKQGDDAINSDSDNESVCQLTKEPEASSGGLIESLGNCEQSECDARPLDQQVVIDDETKINPSCPQYMVEHGSVDGFCAVAAEGGGTGSEAGLNDDRIAMAAAYATVAEPSLLQNGIIKDELVVDAGAEQCEGALHLPVAMDTGCISHLETASELVQNVNAGSLIVFSDSLHHQTDRSADGSAVAGKTSPTLGDDTTSEQPVMQHNVIVSAMIPSESAKTEPSAGLILSQETVTEPNVTSASLKPSQGAETEPHKPLAGLIPSQQAGIVPFTISAGLTPLQAAEAEPHRPSADLIPIQAAETDSTISCLPLQENESDATAYELKHDESCSVKICISEENGEHAIDSRGEPCSYQAVINEDISVSRIALESDQHCLAEKFFPALTSSASAISSEGKNALSPIKVTVDIIAGSTYSPSSEPDQILVKNAALKSKYPIKQRNLRQLSRLFQSCRAQCFFKKGLTLRRGFLNKSVVIPSNVPTMAHGTKRNNCGQCGKHFTSDRTLKRHRIRHRSTLRMLSFKCSYCVKRFSTMASLDRHLISMHVSSVKASCETCHKQFTTVDNFTLHQQHGCVFSAFEEK